MKRFALKAILRSTAIWIAIALSIASVTAPAIARAADNSATPDTRLEVATFAGGCFWCMVSPFAKLEGVVSIDSGYTGGYVKNPTYEKVSAGGTGHVEAVQMMYDPNKVSYERLLEVFWHNVDPTASDHQFCDYGAPYRSEVFYHTEKQKNLAEESKAEIEKSKPFKEPIVTKITAASAFYKAEEYHQNYYKKNPVRYKFYRFHCGRDQRLKELWGQAHAGG